METTTHEMTCTAAAIMSPLSAATSV